MLKISFTNAEVSDHGYGLEVTVTLFDGSEYTGVLRQCGTDYVRDNDNLFLVGRKYYFVEMDYGISCIFRCSHVKRCKYAGGAG